jgi:serine O-acetyltransferase
MRTCAYLHTHAIFRFLFFPFARLILRYYEYRFRIRIPYQTQIGSGLYISRATGIVINPHTVIGRNCNIFGQVTLGGAGREAGKGQPVIGDNVHIGPRAKVIGVVRVGNHVVISADCVVSEDIPDASVVFGNPGRAVPLDESAVYIYRTDYARQFI